MIKARNLVSNLPFFELANRLLCVSGQWPQVAFAPYREISNMTESIADAMREKLEDISCVILLRCDALLLGRWMEALAYPSTLCRMQQRALLAVSRGARTRP